jgi:mono/diheme cytochrome c family protein
MCRWIANAVPKHPRGFGVRRPSAALYVVALLKLLKAAEDRRTPGRWRALLTLAAIACQMIPPAIAAEPGSAPEFRRDVRPILEQFCFDCHADGANKGGVAFDEVNPDHGFADSRDLWWKALKNVRAGLMPPAKKPQPSAEQKALIARWIKTTVFEANPANPDPGRVTVRRLNRVEYRNTVRDLVGVDYDTTAEFPPDDTGYGFDNISDVLTLPPMLLEKYLIAARAIVAEAVPTKPLDVAEKVIPGKRFYSGGPGEGGEKDGRNLGYGGLPLSFYTPASVSNAFTAEHAGHYRLAIDVMINEKYVDNIFDLNRCRLIFRVDGQEMLRREFSWEGGKPYHYELTNQNWTAGDHWLEFELQPLTPDEPRNRTLSVNISSVTVRGPLEKEYWVPPKNYRRFFPKAIPAGDAARGIYARELLGDFARRAYRRPVDAKTIDRLVVLAERTYRQPDKTFEEGIGQGMVAVLASPRFLFRDERIEPRSDGGVYPNVDEFALASRLSYFFWSSMPDEELFRLADRGQLRTNLSAQVKRMLADSRSEALVKNFVGQWLQARDIEFVQMDPRSVLAREEKFDPDQDRKLRRFRELIGEPFENLTPEEQAELRALQASRPGRRGPPRADLNYEVRRAMRLESEKVFDYIIRENRSLLELIDSDYTFLNERLARHYGITNANVTGDAMRRVTLPPDSPRGGVLAQGTVLAVTSNPTRTSPVKRGVFILDNILGTPPPPPPPNIPPLEDATKDVTNRAPSLRETMVAHRANALCSGCHSRMDPLGLALENFNAMGMWREREYGESIDTAGQLITGEQFANFKELKRVLVTQRSMDFYRTLTQKLMTYALGRGLEYYDVETVDQIVDRIVKADGRPSALLMGIVESAPFEKTRGPGERETRNPTPATGPRAEAKNTP